METCRRRRRIYLCSGGDLSQTTKIYGMCPNIENLPTHMWVPKPTRKPILQVSTNYLEAFVTKKFILILEKTLSWSHCKPRTYNTSLWANSISGVRITCLKKWSPEQRDVVYVFFCFKLHCMNVSPPLHVRESSISPTLFLLNLFLKFISIGYFLTMMVLQ